MNAEVGQADTDEGLAAALREYLMRTIAVLGGPQPARKPGHRVPFHWPPHPVSHSYHVHPTDWRGKAQVMIHGESFAVEVARTPYGTFGRVEELWLEAKGDNKEAMLQALEAAAEPLFARQYQIAGSLGLSGRFFGHIRDLGNIDLLKLLYCENRDVSHEAATHIELRASQGVFLPSMTLVLRDQAHPVRRAAQWAVLNLLEDFDSFCRTSEDVQDCILAIRDLIWSAEDDYARTIYKAGVVLGGHLPGAEGGGVLLECLEAPSPYGRRAAIHGLFHVVEWDQSKRDMVVSALEVHSEKDPLPILQEYARRMAEDIRSGGVDHVAEPVLDGES